MNTFSGAKEYRQPACVFSHLAASCLIYCFWFSIDPLGAGGLHLKKPDSFLEIRIRDLEIEPALIGLCAGYELGDWRSEQLAIHLFQWLPEFALTHSELISLAPHNAFDMLIRAAETIYTSPHYKKRGEVGELLLHIAVRQVFDSLPAISKYYYKDSHSTTVKGFDCVHVVASHDESLELWLGEAKIYGKVTDAITDTIKSLKEHTQRDYLRSEFMVITNHIDPNWPLASKLKDLIKPTVSLDDIFKCCCIPIFIAYNSDAVALHNEVNAAFQLAFEKELRDNYKRLQDKGLPGKIKIVVFLLPMKDKDQLLGHFDKRLKQWQQTAKLSK